MGKHGKGGGGGGSGMNWNNFWLWEIAERWTWACIIAKDFHCGICWFACSSEKKRYVHS